MSHKGGSWKTTTRWPTRTMLDYSTYPHLVELIFSFIPTRDLRSIRRVSRKFKVAADKRLAYHLVAIEHDELRTPYGPVPSLWDWDEADRNARILEAVNIGNRLTAYDRTGRYLGTLLPVCFEHAEDLKKLELVRQVGVSQSSTPSFVHASSGVHFLAVPRKFRPYFRTTEPYVHPASRFTISLVDTVPSQHDSDSEDDSDAGEWIFQAHPCEPVARDDLVVTLRGSSRRHCNAYLYALLTLLWHSSNTTLKLTLVDLKPRQPGTGDHGHQCEDEDGQIDEDEDEDEDEDDDEDEDEERGSEGGKGGGEGGKRRSGAQDHPQDSSAAENQSSIEDSVATISQVRSDLCATIGRFPFDSWASRLGPTTSVTKESLRALADRVRILTADQYRAEVGDIRFALETILNMDDLP